MNPKFRSDGALAIAVAVIGNWDNVRGPGSEETVAQIAVKIIDELIEELQK
jgi:hypothetical protein